MLERITPLLARQRGRHVREMREMRVMGVGRKVGFGCGWEVRVVVVVVSGHMGEVGGVVAGWVGDGDGGLHGVVGVGCESVSVFWT